MRAFYLIVLCLMLTSVQAAEGFYDLIGDTLTETERAAVISAYGGTPNVRVPLLVKKGDIDGDGVLDFVVLASNSISVLFNSGTSLITHRTYLRRKGRMNPQNSEMNVVAGPGGRNEILARVGDDCYVAYVSMERMKASGTLLEHEWFRCSEPQAQEKFFRAREDCLTSGGNWGPQGMFRNGGCVRRMADAGKQCGDQSECQGKCIYTGPPVPLGTPVTGQCSASDRTFGCFDRVRDGQYAGRLCVD
jgi:hypothetical protein